MIDEKNLGKVISAIFRVRNMSYGYSPDEVSYTKYGTYYFSQIFIVHQYYEPKAISIILTPSSLLLVKNGRAYSEI